MNRVISNTSVRSTACFMSQSSISITITTTYTIISFAGNSVETKVRAISGRLPPIFSCRATGTYSEIPSHELSVISRALGFSRSRETPRVSHRQMSIVPLSRRLDYLGMCAYSGHPSHSWIHHPSLRRHRRLGRRFRRSLRVWFRPFLCCSRKG